MQEHSPFVERASQTRAEVGIQKLGVCEQAWVDGCKDRGDPRAYSRVPSYLLPLGRFSKLKDTGSLSSPSSLKETLQSLQRNHNGHLVYCLLMPDKCELSPCLVYYKLNKCLVWEWRYMIDDCWEHLGRSESWRQPQRVQVSSLEHKPGQSLRFPKSL